LKGLFVEANCMLLAESPHLNLQLPEPLPVASQQSTEKNTSPNVKKMTQRQGFGYLEVLSPETVSDRKTAQENHQACVGSPPVRQMTQTNLWYGLF